MKHMWFPLNPDELSEKILSFTHWQFSWSAPAAERIIPLLIDYKAAWKMAQAQRKCMYRAFRQNCDRHEAWKRQVIADEIQRELDADADKIFDEIMAVVSDLVG